MLSRRLFTAGLCAAALPAQRRRQPNFVVLFADDLGYGDLGCYGSPDVPTPHIDSLARDGVRFTDGYATAALCSPSRAGLLSGRYQQRFGHEFNPSGQRDRQPEVGIPAEVTILPQRLKPLGYRTGMIGKWHLGATPAYHPVERGFDEYFGFLQGANSFYNERTPGGGVLVPSPDTAAAPLERGVQLPIWRNKEQVREDEYLTDAFAREGAGFIERHRRDPFLLYVAFNAVHAPLMSTHRYLDRVANIPNERHRMLAAMTVAMDDAVGRLLAELKKHNLDRDTCIFFASDNGCPTRLGAGSNGPLNGQKVTYYEGGIRIPYMMRWSGRLDAGKVYRQPVSTLDFTPTMLAAAGARELPKELDGVDLLPFLGGKAKGSPHETLFWRAGRFSAVRRGDWKLLQLSTLGPRLYNLASDLGEKTNLAEKHPEIVRDLAAAFAAWDQSNVAARWKATPMTNVVNGERITWDG